MPANTPRDIVVTIQRETAKALKSPDVLDRLKTGGNEPVGSTPDEFDARFRADVAKFAKGRPHSDAGLKARTARSRLNAGD